MAGTDFAVSRWDSLGYDVEMTHIHVEMMHILVPAGKERASLAHHVDAAGN